MKCPDCGTENPDNAWFCGECGKTLGGTTTRGPRNGTLKTDPYGTQSGLGGSPLNMAWTALLVALILLSASVALRFYYFEGLMFGDGDFFEHMSIESWMSYTSSFGDLAALLGLAFVVVALTRHQSRTDLLARIPVARLATAKWILIIAIAIQAVGAISTVAARELQHDWNENTTRLTFYSFGIAWLVATAALFVFVLGLKEAEQSE